MIDMFNWISRKAGAGAVDGALERLAEKLSSVDIKKIDIVSKYLTEEEAQQFHKDLARLIAAGVKIAAKIAEQKANA